MLNYLDSIALTKLDVLSGLDKIKICNGYKYKKEVYEDLPCHQTILHKCTPLYEEFEGWSEDITGILKYEDLPPAARKYIERIEEIIKVPVSMVSVGPERNQIIIRDDNLKKRLFESNNRSTLII